MLNPGYVPPVTELLTADPAAVIAQSYNYDNGTEYIDEDYGDLI